MTCFFPPAAGGGATTASGSSSLIVLPICECAPKGSSDGSSMSLSPTGAGSNIAGGGGSPSLNVDALAAGLTAGLVVAAALVALLVIWRRKRLSKSASDHEAGGEKDKAADPPTALMQSREGEGRGRAAVAVEVPGVTGACGDGGAEGWGEDVMAAALQRLLTAGESGEVQEGGYGWKRSDPGAEAMVWRSDGGSSWGGLSHLAALSEAGTGAEAEAGPVSPAGMTSPFSDPAAAAMAWRGGGSSRGGPPHLGVGAGAGAAAGARAGVAREQAGPVPPDSGREPPATHLPASDALPLFQRKPSDDIPLDLTLGAGKDVVVYTALFLGKGAAGEVYGGRYGNRAVAVKKIVLSWGADMTGPDPRDIEDMKREMQIMARLSHPNIVRIYGGRLTPPDLFVVLELMDKDLNAVLHVPGAPPLSLLASLAIAHQVIQALVYLHGLHVIHRDLKPGNILVTKEGVAKISDFGLARCKYKTFLSTKTCGVGTVPYMAPECFDVGLGAISTGCDIFSFGTILWELLTRRRPWDHLENEMQIMYQVSKGQRLDIPDDDRVCPPAVGALIKDCWQSYPGRRPTAVAVQQRLEQVLLSMDSRAVGGEWMRDAR